MAKANDPAAKLDAERENLRQTIAVNLKALAEKKGTNARTLSKETGLPSMNVYRAFGGEQESSFSTIAILARALRVKVDALLQG